MNKNSIIGLVLIGVIMFGFSWYQAKQAEAYQAEKYKADSIARIEALQQLAIDSLHRMQAAQERGEGGKLDEDAAKLIGQNRDNETLNSSPAVRYEDSMLQDAAASAGKLVTISNDKLEVTFTTRGAQVYSVRIKDHKAYGQDSLIFVRPGSSDYGVAVFAGEKINTRDFNFALASHSDSVVVMRLAFENGGFIEQRYSLQEGSYMLADKLSFKDMGDLVPRSRIMFDIDWTLAIPHIEKGFRNEKQYSKMAAHCPGEDRPELFAKGKDGEKRFDSKVEWFGFCQQFFSVIMTSENGFASSTLSTRYAEEFNERGDLMVCSASTRNELVLTEGNACLDYSFYFGPNEYKSLRAYGRNYDKLITIGGSFIGLITRWIIIPCFDWFSSFCTSYGLIILLMTLLIKLVLSPLTIKSYMSSAKMNALRPEIDKLNEKFPKAASDQKEAMKKNQATMELYKRAGINPMGGCLPMLLQFPILWAMFRFFPASIELRQQPFLWAEDLSAYDSIADWNFSVLGMDHLSLFALLMAVSMCFYSMLTMPKSNDPTQKPMRFMSIWLMPIMMFFICNSLSSALSYYYLLSNLITMLQTFVIRKWFVKPEALLAKIEASKGKPLPKSKWQLRLEEAQKMANEQQKKKSRR